MGRFDIRTSVPSCVPNVALVPDQLRRQDNRPGSSVGASSSAPRPLSPPPTMVGSRSGAGHESARRNRLDRQACRSQGSGVPSPITRIGAGPLGGPADRGARPTITRTAGLAPDHETGRVSVGFDGPSGQTHHTGRARPAPSGLSTSFRSCLASRGGLSTGRQQGRARGDPRWRGQARTRTDALIRHDPPHEGRDGRRAGSVGLRDLPAQRLGPAGCGGFELPRQDR